MITFPNAKINLGLHVVEKRKDGYHNIETCFYPIPLYDVLEIVPAPEFSFTQVGLSLDSFPADNLVMKALNAYRKHYDVTPLSIYLKKVIPFGAGLGGGSADAAFMLKLLRKYNKQNYSSNETENKELGCFQPQKTDISQYPDDDELEKMAVEIGADCPFFVRNKPTIASEIGNIFDSIELSIKGYTLCIIKPNIIISTKDAYNTVKPAKPTVSLREILQSPVNEWKVALTNVFEPGIFLKYPIIADIKAYLYAQGAVYAAMSGSGSAVFGLFENDVNVSFPDCFVWKGLLE